MDLCRRTQQLWHAYLSEEDPQAVEEVLEWLTPDCVVIGTGRHEYYTSRQGFVAALRREVAERQTVRLKLVDEWYGQRELGPQACLVYGGLHMNVMQTEDAYADMDTRFSVLYQKIGEEWKVVHVHQSMPDLEQRDGEYYPKTLTNQVREAKDLAEHMRSLARQDSLTGLLNHRTFFEEGARLIAQGGSYWCFVLDLDDFKRVNDVCGHSTGDELLRRVASAVRMGIRNEDLAGRVGGDEFAVLCAGLEEEREVSALARRLLELVTREAGTISEWSGLSVGIARVCPGEDLTVTFQRADKALYRVKRGEKNSFSIESAEAAEKGDVLPDP